MVADSSCAFHIHFEMQLVNGVPEKPPHFHQAGCLLLNSLKTLTKLAFKKSNARAETSPGQGNPRRDDAIRRIEVANTLHKDEVRCDIYLLVCTYVSMYCMTETLNQVICKHARH